MKERDSGLIDISGLLRYWLKHWYWFAISLAIFGAAGLVFAMSQQPKYAVRANVKIATDDPKGGLASSVLAGSGFGDIFGASADVQDEIFVISSHTVYRDVAKALRLNVKHEVSGPWFSTLLKFNDYPVDVTFDPLIADTLRAGLTFNVEVKDNGRADISGKIKKDKMPDYNDVELPYTIKTPYGEFTVETTDFYDGKKLSTTIYVSGYDGAAEALSEDVMVDMASKKSNVINLAIDTEVPEMGKAILNEIVEQYNKRGIAERTLQNEKAAEFIADRLKYIQSDLDAAEAELQHFKESNNLTDLEAEAKYQYTKRGEVESNLIKAQTQVEILKMTADFMHNPANAYAPVPITILGDGQNSALPIQTYNQLVAEYLDLRSTAKDDNAALRKLQARVDGQRDALTKGIDKALDAARVELGDLKRQMSATDSRLGQMPEQEREFINISRQRRVKNELYLFMLQRQEETALMLANTSPKAEIIDNAFQKVDPVGLSRKVIFAIFLMAGLLVPIVLLYLRKTFRNRFSSREELEHMSSVPLLGEICTDKSGNHLVVTSSDTSSTSELFRLIRANLQFVLSGSSDKVVLVTSTSAGEGKSFVSVNLASSLSLLGKKVLLVGMDIRAPRLADYLHIDPNFGVTQYLSSPDVKLDQCIEPIMENFDVMCAGPVPPNPGELLLSEHVDKLFETLRHRYDYIVIDSAPVGMVSDTMTLMRIADATVYVCRANYTSLSDVRFFNDLYDEGRLKKMSLVVNGTARRKGYGYGYGNSGKKRK